MINNIEKIAAQVMHVTVEDALKNHKKIPQTNAYYFWNPVRGGISVIVSEDGEKLGAASSVSYERHIKAFMDGKRN